MIQSSIGFTRKEGVAENGVVAGSHDLVAQVGVKIMQQGSTPRVGGSQRWDVVARSEQAGLGVGVRP